MNKIISYQDLNPTIHFEEVFENKLTKTGQWVQIRTCSDKMSTFQRIILIVKAIALVIFTFTAALAFQWGRDLCKEAFNFKAKKLFIDFKTLPANEVTKVVKTNGLMLEHASDIVKANREVVKEAVEQNGLALKFADNILKNDPELILLALKTYSNNEDYFFQNALMTVMQNGMDLNNLPYEMKKNKDIVMAAVKQNGLALQFASEELKNDRQVAFLAVDRNKEAMEFVGSNISACMKSVLKILEPGVKRNVVHSLKIMAPELFSLREFLLKVIPHDFTFHPDKQFHNDREMIRIGFKVNEEYLEKASEEIRDDKPFILSCIEHAGKEVIKYASLNLRKDKQVVLAAIKKGATLQYVSEDLRKVKEVVLAAVEADGNLEYVSAELKKDKDIALAAIRKGKLEQLPTIIENENDPDILLEAVKKEGESLEYIPKQKHTKLIVEAAMKQNISAFRFASMDALAEVIKTDENLKKNKNFFMSIFKFGFALLLEHASNDLKKDKVVVLEAMKSDKKAFQFADLQFKNDRTFILAETDLDDTILTFTSNELKNDGDFIRKAIAKKGIDYLKYASNTLKGNRDFIETLMKEKMVKALKYASPEIRKDKVFLSKFDTEKYQYPLCEFFAFVDDELKNDFQYVLNVVRKMGLLLEYASEGLRGNREIVLAAVTSRGLALEYASSELKKDKGIVLIAVQAEYSAFKYASNELREDRAFIIEVAKTQSLLLEDKELRTRFSGDEEVILASIKSNDHYAEGGMRYASVALRNNQEFILKAVKENYHILCLASKDLQANKEFMVKAFKLEPRALQHFYNKAFAKEMVTLEPSWFQHLPKQLQSDKAFVIELLDAEVDILNYLSDTLRNDGDIFPRPFKFE